MGFHHAANTHPVEVVGNRGYEVGEELHGISLSHFYCKYRKGVLKYFPGVSRSAVG